MKKTAPKYDAIILGSGIAGLGAAYALVRRGKKVLIVSPNTRLKGESTPASAGILDPFLESSSPKHPFFKLKKRAFLKLPRQIREIEKESGIQTGYTRTGMLFAALTVKEEKKLKARLVSHKPAGIPVKWINRTQALRKWPYLGGEIRGVLFYPTLGRLFPARFQEALQRVVRRRGVKTLKVKSRVTLLLKQGRVCGIRVKQKNIASDCVINAGGSWADQMRLSALRFPIFPVRGQVVIVRGNTQKLKTVVHSAAGVYIVPWEKGTCLLGSTVEKAGFNASVQAPVIQRIHREAAAMVPALKAFKPFKQWAGLRPCSKDHLPVLGKTSIKGYYMAASYYRSGIVISLYAGELLAEGIFSKSFSKELTPFSPLRFSKERPLI